MGGGKCDCCFVSRYYARCVFFLLLLSFAVMPVRGSNSGMAVQLPSNSEECFFEDIMAVGVKVFFHFTVTTGGSFDVDTTIYNPDKTIIWKATRESGGRIVFKSRIPGRHYFCFSNKMSSITTKIVLFSIVVGELGEEAGKKERSAFEMDSLGRSIMRIQQGLFEIHDVQWYLRRRERVHRATTEVANSRIFIWSTIEIIMIAFLGIGNVWYMRRLFNKRRIV